jgi:hypothetical protein
MIELNEINELYRPDNQPTAISEELARQLGRLLVLSKCEKIGGFSTNPNSKLTVRQMLQHCDESRSYSSNYSHRADIVVGPDYYASDEDEYCLPGIAIWKLPS